MVFFTATPFRADGRPICDDIAVPVQYAYRLLRNKAIESKIIRPARFQDFPVNKGGNLFEKLLHDTVDCLEKKEKVSSLPDDKKQVAMIIMGNVQEADDMAAIASDKYPQLPAVAIHRNLPINDRKKAMSDIKSGRIRIIIIVKMLLEGFDHPPVSIAAICTNICSPVKFAQFIGRAQRVMPGEKDVVADVISLKVFDQSENYNNYDKEWLIPGTDEDVEEEHENPQIERNPQ